MLQPLQLQEVSDRYPQEIAELRDFLRKAGFTAGTEQSLPAIVQRLQRDRAFHRDLTSHIWVVIHSARTAINYANLMGILAIAAAGPHFASQAHEDDAHALLRFVLEARSALSGGATQPAAPRHNSSAERSAFLAPAVAPALAPLPIQTPISRELPRREESGTWQTRPSSIRPVRSALLDDEEPSRSRRPFLWLLAVCALLAASFGLYTRYRGAWYQPPVPQPSPATVASVSPAAPVPSETVPPAPPKPIQPKPIQPKAAPHKAAQPKAKPAHPHESAARKHIPAKPPAQVTPLTAATPPRPSPAVVTHPATATTPRPAVTAAAQPKPAPAAPVSTEADRTHIALNAQPPHLERRTPEERAELNPGSLNTTVHATTLGSAAANVVYSPVPSYPSAAANARIQGEVKVQADVDLRGNVASVRVISGPPLLREAALDAAQRWRFRPNMDDGEPNSMRVTTVFVFQLP